MNRGIDHLVLCVRDLDAARERYARLGFTLTPPAEHPFGTGNSLVQLQGCFLELLAVTRPERIAPPEPGSFGFAVFNRDFLARREGLSQLVFQSDDARRDQAEFAAGGLETYAPFDFSRQATLPDGAQVTVAFSLAFVTDARMPEASFFVCQQHAPEYFWKAEYQRHANGAVSVAEVVMVAADPPALADLFGGLQGADNVTSREDALRVTTARGRVAVLTPEAFARRFPGAVIADAPPSPHFAGYVVAVADLEGAAQTIERAGVPLRRDGGRLWIAPEDAFGTLIEFVQNGA